MLPRVDLDRLSPADLKALVIRLMETVAGLEHTVAAQREEIAPQGSQGSPADQAERDGAGEGGYAAEGGSAQAPPRARRCPSERAREPCRDGRGAGRLALQ